jgi:hypothetical protein
MKLPWFKKKQDEGMLPLVKGIYMRNGQPMLGPGGDFTCPKCQRINYSAVCPADGQIARGSKDARS